MQPVIIAVLLTAVAILCALVLWLRQVVAHQVRIASMQGGSMEPESIYCIKCGSQLVVTKTYSIGYDRGTGEQIIAHDLRCPKKTHGWLDDGHDEEKSGDPEAGMF